MTLTSFTCRGIRRFHAQALSLTFALLPLAQAIAAPSQAEVQKKAEASAVFDRTVLPIPPYQKLGKTGPTMQDSDPAA